MVIYYASAEAMAQMQEKTPEEQKENMKPWMEWAERCGEGLVDLGAPLGNGQKVTANGTAPSEREVAGYSVLQAEDMDGVVAMLADHPHLAWHAGCEIEVYEAMPMTS